LNLTSATDGGYGEEIGSWGYLLFFDNEEKPILKGYSAETSEFDTMQSTREELLGMLAVEYIMQILGTMWGLPNINLGLAIISDIESAIGSREDNGKVVLGAKGIIRPDIELKMALNRLEEDSKWIKRRIEWTKSHVNKEGLASYETVINQKADDLATTGRETVLSGERQPVQHHMYPGAVAGIKIQGENVTNNVVKNVRKWSHHRKTKIYLKEKYGWAE